MKKEERDKYDQVYGIFKFKVPLPKEQERAMGLSGESTLFKKMIMNNYYKYYDTIKPPEEGDWLMTHKEFGQTYDEYIRSGCIQVDQNRDTIYILPLSLNQDSIMDQDFITSILLLCEAYFYGMKVRLSEIKSDFKSVETRKNKNEAIELNAEQFLDKLSSNLPDNAFCLIGIIENELYKESTNKNGKNVFKPCNSMKSISKKTSIISLAKYDFLSKGNLKKVSKERKQKLYFYILKRVCKVILNEICCMFGMKNCTFFLCNMNGADSLMEFDNRPIELCPICLRKLITNINCKGEDIKNTRMKNANSVYERFVKIRDILQENFNGHGIFENEISWFNERIKDLGNEI